MRCDFGEHVTFGEHFHSARRSCVDLLVHDINGLVLLLYYDRNNAMYHLKQSDLLQMCINDLLYYDRNNTMYHLKQSDLLQMCINVR